MAGSNRYGRGRSHGIFPPIPQHPSTHCGAFGPVPRPPGLQPPPPYTAAPSFPGGGYQPIRLRQCQWGSSPLCPVTITKRCLGVSVMFLIILSQVAAFIFFYDLPSTIGRYSGIKEELRIERERWEKAREDYFPRGAFWGGVLPAVDCRAYGKREYWGTLENIPESWTDMNACMNMPVEIKGVSVRRPDRCAYVEGSPHIHGYWMVDWNQSDCKPWHRDFHDTGCTNLGSGIRRVEAQVVGILDRKEQDWRILCESTPMTWNHITYDSPTHCDSRLFGKKVAIWDIPDESC